MRGLRHAAARAEPHEDDAPGPLRDHRLGRDLTSDRPRRLDRQPVDRTEAVDRDVLGVRRELATSVVHEGVDPLPLVKDTVDEGGDCLRLADVAHLRQTDAALEDDLLADRLKRLGAASADRHPVPVGRELQRGCPTDSRATTGDDGDATMWIGAVHLSTVALPRSMRSHMAQPSRR